MQRAAPPWLSIVVASSCVLGCAHDVKPPAARPTATPAAPVQQNVLGTGTRRPMHDCEARALLEEPNVDGCVLHSCADGTTALFRTERPAADYQSRVGCYELERFESRGGLPPPPIRIELTDRWVTHAPVPALDVEATGWAHRMWWIGFGGETVVHFFNRLDGLRLCTRLDDEGLRGVAFIDDDTGYHQGTTSPVVYRRAPCTTPRAATRGAPGRDVASSAEAGPFPLPSSPQ